MKRFHPPRNTLKRSTQISEEDILSWAKSSRRNTSRGHQTSVPEKTLEVFQRGEIRPTPSTISTGHTGIIFDDPFDQPERVIFTEIELPIEKLFGEKQSNLRFYTFVWLELFYFERAKFKEENAGIKERMLEDITNFFNSRRFAIKISIGNEIDEDNKEDFIKNIVSLYTSRAPHQEKTFWIKSTNRSKNWLSQKTKQLDRNNISSLPNLVGYELILAIVDFWDHPVTAKTEALSIWQKQWNEIIKSDYQVKWLDEHDHAKARRAEFWNYISEKHTDKLQISHPPKNHEDVLGIFDQLHESGVDRKKIIQQLKKIEDDANKEPAVKRQQKNFSLWPETLKKLFELVEDSGLNIQDTVDKLICDAHASMLAYRKARPD